MELAHMDIGHGPRQFLIEITLHEGLSQEELSDLLLMDKTTTARSVKRLEDHGYIIRKRDPRDRRQYHLFPTEKAACFLPEILQARANVQDALTQCFSEGEKVELQILLSRLADQASALRDKRKIPSACPHCKKA